VKTYIDEIIPEIGKSGGNFQYLTNITRANLDFIIPAKRSLFFYESVMFKNTIFAYDRSTTSTSMVILMESI
jgi:hypothetical protein